MSARQAVPDMSAMLATIEREAGRRGLVLELRGTIVTDHEGQEAPEGDRFCSVARAAWAATDGQGDLARQRHAHVAQLVGAVDRSARDRSGAVRVARTSWVLLKSYAATGAPSKRESGQ